MVHGSGHHGFERRGYIPGISQIYASGGDALLLIAVTANKKRVNTREQAQCVQFKTQQVCGPVSHVLCSQGLFARDSFSEVLVYVNKKHCYCVSAVSNGRFSLMNPEHISPPEHNKGASTEGTKQFLHQDCNVISRKFVLSSVETYQIPSSNPTRHPDQNPLNTFRILQSLQPTCRRGSL